MKQCDAPILTYDEITRFDCINSLISAYSQKGFDFKDTGSFLGQVKHDWSLEVNRMELENLKNPIAERFQGEEVEIDGLRYKLFGIKHDLISGSGKYKRLVIDALDNQRNLLYESGLSLIFFRPDATEIPDFCVNSFMKSFKEGAECGITLPLFFSYMFSRHSQKSRSVEMDLKEINFPSEARGELPFYVHMGEKERNGFSYSHSEARSAYQAEFMRAYKSGEEKTLLAGKNHSRQIKYFLRRGVKNTRIVDLAQNHAEVLTNNPERFKWINRMYTAKESAAILSGGIVGASPYFILMTMPEILRILNESLNK